MHSTHGKKLPTWMGKELNTGVFGVPGAVIITLMLM